MPIEAQPPRGSHSFDRHSRVQEHRRVFSSTLMQPALVRAAVKASLPEDVIDYSNKSRSPATGLHLKDGVAGSGICEAFLVTAKYLAEPLRDWFGALDVCLGREGDLGFSGHRDCAPVEVHVGPVQGDEFLTPEPSMKRSNQ